MLIRLAEGRVFLRTPAKVNLFLEVVGKRPDGYHELTTLMLAVSLYDTLEIREVEKHNEVRLACDHPNLSTGPDNLVCRAAQVVRERCGVRKGLEIRLWKRIPMAAGLAGGSTDAAATLAGLNQLYRLGLDRQELIRLGGELGSDVSFFFAPPAAWCTGRGEIVQPVTLGRPLDLVLVCPPAGLSTAQVFGRLKVPDGTRDGRAIRQALAAGDVETMGRELRNRLQPAAEELCPAVAEWCGRLARTRPLGQLMTGSGSTVYALARDPVDALRITRELRSLRDEGDGSRVFVVRSCD
jgi:4-diphosphocytidyl-2-C-methyl-D-erythritol kinase